MTAGDVDHLPADLPIMDEALRRVTGLSIAALARRAAGARTATLFPAGRRVCVVPVTAGQGIIEGFSEAVAAVCRHIGCQVSVSPHTDVAGWAFAAERGEEVVLAADDQRFIALNIRMGVCIDNGIATGEGYATALDAASGGVAGRAVLVVGLGSVGMAAAVRLHHLGASVLVADLDAARVEVALHTLPVLAVDSTEAGLGVCDLVLDASTGEGFIPGSWVSPASVVAAAGVPCGVTPDAAEVLGDRLIHDPLVLGVATMVAKACLGVGRGDRRAGGRERSNERGRPLRSGRKAT